MSRNKYSFILIIKATQVVESYETQCNKNTFILFSYLSGGASNLILANLSRKCCKDETVLNKGIN